MKKSAKKMKNMTVFGYIHIHTNFFQSAKINSLKILIPLKIFE